MKVKEGFMLKEICGEYLIVPVGAQSIEFRSIIKLNETGVLLWELMQNDVSEHDLVDAIMEKYNAEETVVSADVSAFCQRLSEAGLLEE